MPISRRSFVAVAGAAQAAAANRTPVVVAPYLQSNIAAQGDTIRVATMYKFDPVEIEKIQAAVPTARVEIAMANTREEFRAKLRDADVVYGALRGDDLDFAPKLKWLQWGGAGMEGMDRVNRQSPSSSPTTPACSRPASPRPPSGCCSASLAASRNTTCRSSPSGR